MVIPCPPPVQKKIEALVGGVSRETFSKLEVYLSFLLQENKKYNLVGPQEEGRLWERHVLDSVQLFPFLVGEGGFLDVGSGAGFPGVVLSLLGLSGGVLVESSQKKCSFLSSVSRETGVDFLVVCDRVEALQGCVFDVVVSRAVAPIETLLLWTRGVSSLSTKWFFLKGKRAQEEVGVAQKRFSFGVDFYPSVTSQEGKIVKIQKVFSRRAL